MHESKRNRKMEIDMEMKMEMKMKMRISMYGMREHAESDSMRFIKDSFICWFLFYISFFFPFFGFDIWYAFVVSLHRINNMLVCVCLCEVSPTYNTFG